MDLGSLLLLTSVIGIAGLGLAFVAGKIFGIDILGAMLSFFSTFMNILTRVIGWAPRWLQVALFILVGVGLLGAVSGWVVANDVVCSDGIAYRADSFLSATMAKMLPGSEEKSVEELQAASIASSGDGRVSPSVQSPRLVEDVSLFWYDPSTTYPSFKRWGTFVTIGDNTSTVPDLPSEMDNDMLIVLPSYTVVENENISNDRSAFGSNLSIFKYTSEANLRISKATYLSTLFNDRVAGRCYMDDVQTISFLFGAPGDDLAEVTYLITSKSMDGQTSVDFYVEYSNSFGSVGVNDIFDLFTNPNAISTDVGNESTLNACPDVGILGEVFLKTGGTLKNRAGNNYEVASQGGWVSAKYFSVQELGVDPDDIRDGEITRRGAFIQKSSSEFTALGQGSPDDVLTYSCTENDEVTTLVWGLDVFDPKTLVFLVFLGVILVVLSKLNMI